METQTKEVKLEWLRSRMFVGTDHLGKSIAIGYLTDEEPKACGINPSDMLLLAAASCSAYDVVQILEKGKQPLENLKVDVTAEQARNNPTLLSPSILTTMSGEISQPIKFNAPCSSQRINTVPYWPH